MSTLKYLDMLYQKGDMEKSQFFKKNLARVITKLPKVSLVPRLYCPAFFIYYMRGKKLGNTAWLGSSPSYQRLASFPGSTAQLFYYVRKKSWAVEPGNEATKVDST